MPGLVNRKHEPIPRVSRNSQSRETLQGYLCLMILIGVTLLTACEGVMPREERAIPAEQEPVVQVPEDETITDANRFSRAIRSLQEGKSESARRDLDILLASRPKHSMARDLIEQMDADPQAYLGADYSEYQVQSGDSLSRIAEQYLGDPLKFLILARYNGIDNPSVLKPGQRIRVPRKGPIPAPAPPPPSSQPTQGTELSSAYVSAKDAYQAGNYDDAIALLEEEMKHTPQARSKQLLLHSYVAQSERLAADGQLLAGRTLLEKAVVLEPSDDDVSAKLAVLQDRIQAERLYEQGVAQAASEQFDRAYESFTQALTFRPDHALAKEQREKMRADVVDQYHRKAMSLYRQQELQEAIELWDKVLAIDSEHESAQLYRTRALELQQRLQELKITN